ncbi:STAS domain-containing protein [Halotalea alkalilenta]|uniref:STAS domain-containing protein n=1 Tax=Halotalea alkalilenta TaxID=376489 RepID=UPI0005BA65B6|nr:STAS domain-containing protein [Halotalea alkalilenta]
MAELLIESEDVTLRAEGDTLVVQGRPGFDSAARLAEAGRAWLGKRGQDRAGQKKTVQGKVRFDVNGVEISNSAVLCVLLEWLRTARQSGLEVEAIELPARMRDLVEFSGLAPVFASSAERLSTSA